MNHQASDLSQPSPGRNRLLRLAGRFAGRAGDADMKVVVVPPVGAAPWSSTARPCAVSHSAFLIAALTKMRSTSGSSAAALMIPA